MKIVSFFLTGIIYFLISYTAAAQQRQRCATDEYSAMLEKQFPEIVWQKEITAKKYEQFMQMRSASRSSAGTIYVIPVVVHIVHHPDALNPGDSSNITDQRVYDQIKILNEDYRRIAGTSGDGPGADMQIEFQLARRDPDGNCTKGINRIGHPISVKFNNRDSVQNKALKAIIHWPRDKYLNIYVVHSFLNPVFGYSSMPLQTGTPRLDSIDGVGIWYQSFGYSEDPDADVGRTATHEVGHWLGLEHTFLGGCMNNNCLLDGDGICDTPPAATATSLGFPCPAAFDNCHTDEDDASLNNPFRAVAAGGMGDQDVQFQNYMDYSSDSCMDRFTTGQYNKVLFYLANERASNVLTANLVLTGNKALIHDFDSLGATAGLNGRAAAMVEWKGKLVIGGNFTNAGGLPCNGLVTWDGVQYDTIPGSPVFDNLSNVLTSMAVYKGDLYIGGTFIFYTLARHLVKYNGSSWSKVTTNTDIKATSDPVRTLMVYKGKLYVGGDFGKVNGDSLNVNRIATWDGAAWASLGTGTTNGVAGGSSAVYAMTIWNDMLIVGGRFSTAGGISCDKVAAWNGNVFSSFNTGTNVVNSGSLNALHAFGGRLFTGGDYASVAGNLLPGLTVYNPATSAWTQAAAGAVGSFNIRAIESFNGYIWTGGVINDIALDIFGVYTYDPILDSFKKVTANHKGLNDAVMCMTVYKDKLYIGGDFTGLQGNTGPDNTTNNNIIAVKLICPYPTTDVTIVQQNEGNIRLYPNPAEMSIKIENAKEPITIYNVLGKSMITIHPAAHGITELNISSFAAGVYLVRSGDEVQRFVKY